MKADPKVIADLQSACGTLATMAEQYRVDMHQLKAIDLDWLASRLGKWYHKSEAHLGIFLDRVLGFGGDPSYTLKSPTSSGGDIRGVLVRNQAMAQAAFDQFCQMRKNSWNARADGTPDDYEHAIQFFEKVIIKCERELNLIDGLGLPGYIGARLEDA